MTSMDQSKNAALYEDIFKKARQISTPRYAALLQVSNILHGCLLWRWNESGYVLIDYDGKDIYTTDTFFAFVDELTSTQELTILNDALEQFIAQSDGYLKLSLLCKLFKEWQNPEFRLDEVAIHAKVAQGHRQNKADLPLKK